MPRKHEESIADSNAQGQSASEAGWARLACHPKLYSGRGRPTFARLSSPRAMVGILRAAPERRLVPVRGYVKGCSGENVEFVGIAA